MKRAFWILMAISLCFANSVSAQKGGILDKEKSKGSFKIENGQIIIEASGNAVTFGDTVYIDFGKSSLLKLKPVFSGIDRVEMSKFITGTDKCIYVQIGGTKYGKDYIVSDAQYLVKEGGGNTPYDKAWVIISKDSLPVKITADDKTITVCDFSEFDCSDQKKLEDLRKILTISEDSLPSCKNDSIPKEKLKEYSCNALDLGLNNFWKDSTKVKYYIDGEEVAVENNKIKLTDEICSKIGNEFVISYSVDFKHEGNVFAHSRKGNLAKIKVIGSGCSSWMIWAAIAVGIIVAVIAFVIVLKKKKGKGKGQGEGEKVNPNNKIAGNDKGPKSNEVSPAPNNGTKVDGRNTSAPVADLLNEILPEEVKAKTLEEKKEYIKEQLELCETLKLEKETLTNKLEVMKNSSQNAKSPAADTNAINERAFRNIINLLREKKVFSSIVDKQDDGNGKKAEDVLRNIINVLSTEFGNRASQSPVQNSGTSDITEAQMKIDSNRRKMMGWLIGLLEEKGYKKLNRNRSVDENINSLYSELSYEHPSEETVIDNAIANGTLTDAQKKQLLSLLVEKINSRIGKESDRVEGSLSVEGFVSIVSEKLQSPATFEEAQENVLRNNIATVNEILESEMTDLNKESLESALRCAFVKLLNRSLKDFQSESLEDAMQALSASLETSKNSNEMLQEYKVSSMSELTSAIRNKLSADILGSVASNVKELFPDKEFDSVQKLLNALLKLSKEAKEANEQVAEDLEEKITMREPGYVSSGSANILELIDKYNSIVIANENALKSNIATKKSEIENLNAAVSEKETEISALADKNSLLMGETSFMIESLHTSAECILQACRTILNPCSDNDESQCMDIEDRLFAELSNTMRRLQSFVLDAQCVPADARKEIQNVLIDEISAQNSPLNTVCRYFAYSRLPFMTDTSREYGVTFKRKNMAELYSAVERLYVMFGISLNIPDLFVAGFEEGDFENLTGQTYGDLDNLCQNSRNHFDNIDSNVKPANVIVDVINVGYAVDGRIERKTSVLTY